MSEETKQMLKRGGLILLSCIVPAAIIIFKPLGMNLNQAATCGGLLLVIIWWTTNLVKKVPASIFLLVWFIAFSGAPVKTVLTFPLSETFITLIITYLFSRAISNAGIIDRLLLPVLRRFAKTTPRYLITVVLVFAITMYAVPQPLARLILVATMFDGFLKGTKINDTGRSVLMYAVFMLYAVVNMACKDADLIMNYAACAAGGVSISNMEWTKAMLVPTVAYAAVLLLLFGLVFRKEIKGIDLAPVDREGEADPLSRASATAPPEGGAKVEKPLSRSRSRYSLSLAIILATIVLWISSPLWGSKILLFGYITANTIVTVISVILLFAIGTLKLKDFNAIDIATLVFLAAAFSIGGVMKACGAADIVFGRLSGIFPDHFSWVYILVMVLATMLLHMVLGSNTTTLSVAVPGLVLLCEGVVSPQIAVYAAIVAVAFHAILPFHSVNVMIGASNGYFPAKYVTRFGIFATPVVFLSAVLIYLPWWRLIGIV